jgi:hypothetical protein
MKVEYYKCDASPSSALLDKSEVVEFKLTVRQWVDDKNIMKYEYITKHVCVDCAGELLTKLFKGKNIIDIENILKGDS